MDVLVLFIILLLVSVKVGELTEEVNRLKEQVKTYQCEELATTAEIQ